MTKADIEDIEPKREVVKRSHVAKVEKPAGLIVTQHDISRVMFEIYKLPVHPQAKLLAGNIHSGKVLFYVEEPTTPAPMMELWLRGFRSGEVIALKQPHYICSVFEALSSGYRDHAHLYAEMWRPGR